MEISFGLVVQFHSRFTIRSTITETMYFLAKSRFASVYEDLVNRIRIPSVYDVKKIFALHLFATLWSPSR